MSPHYTLWNAELVQVIKFILFSPRPNDFENSPLLYYI